jgi:hypothetical protein
VRVIRKFVATTSIFVALVTPALLVGCSNASNASVSATLPSDGAGLVSSLCNGCHPQSRVDAAKKDRTGWTATISRMQSHGLAVTEAQSAAIVDYLTKRDGGS